MKKFLFFTVIFFSVSAVLAQGFTGSLEFNYSTLKDTNTNVYLVKNNLVKLDQYEKKSKGIVGSFIFDLTKNEIKFVNPKRKVWGTQNSEAPPVIKGKCEVTKGKDTKMVQGIKCSDYTVYNVEENTSITYWVSTDKFNFFLPLMKLWNRKDKQSVYFTQIKGLPEGSMPLMSEEKLLSDENKIISTLVVTKITKTAPTDAELSVPAGYKKFE
ncbi:MAG: DUF4412 domain-containing protein [Bacteroidetes bacterium]|nr:DUF4412 domain-containing protein [Bacteroidota bacterium]